jgi:hypothetical protein
VTLPQYNPVRLQGQEVEMATRKRLTDADGNKIDVNLEQVAYIRHSSQSAPQIVFLNGGTVTVRESALEIHQLMPTFSK